MPSFPSNITWTNPWSAAPTAVPTGTATCTPAGGWEVGYRPGSVTFQVSNTELNPLGTPLPVYVTITVTDAASHVIGSSGLLPMPLNGGTIAVPVPVTFLGSDIGSATVLFQDYYIAGQPYPWAILTPAETNTNEVLGATFSVLLFWTDLVNCAETGG